MKIRHSSKFVRLGVAALLAAPLAIGAIGAGTPAGATTGMLVNTKFEIDGNPQVNSTGDWLSTPAQYPELRDNFVTTTEPCGGGTDPNRFIPGTKLDQINVDTVKGLKPAWFFEYDTYRGQLAEPIVVDGVIYVSTAWSKVYALDGATGKQIWFYDPKVPGKQAISICCDSVNRGVAV